MNHFAQKVFPRFLTANVLFFDESIHHIHLPFEVSFNKTAPNSGRWTSDELVRPSLTFLRGIGLGKHNTRTTACATRPQYGAGCLDSVRAQ